MTLALPQLNRYVKIHKDAAEWVPDLNQCWFAARVVAVRLEYNLTIDRREADALEAILQRTAPRRKWRDLSGLVNLVYNSLYNRRKRKAATVTFQTTHTMPDAMSQMKIKPTTPRLFTKMPSRQRSMW